MTILSAHRAFLADNLARQTARRSIIDPTYAYDTQPEIGGHTPRANADAGPSKSNIPNYVPEEETLRNDLTERYIQSGEFGSNYIQGAEEGEICEEYPALRKLMDLKAQHVSQNSHPPLHLPLEDTLPGTILSATTPTRFDVILLRPTGTWAETAELPIRNLSADPSFVFLWVGKGDDEGLEKGRECFAKWGFRRAEDIVWVRTNKSRADNPITDGEGGKIERKEGTGGGGLFASSKEHCLMGIRGTVRRSTDTRFVHCNVDTDILVWEQDDPSEKFPPYLYTLIENFCLGARRLELFGNPKSRRGWVSATTAPLPPHEAPLKFDPATYPTLLPQAEPRPILPFHPEIDSLRPKSPPRRGGGGRGGHLPHNPHPHPHSHSQPYSHSARPPRHNQHQHQQNQYQNPAQMHQMQMHAQAQAQMAMQMQMQHMQMMAAMNLNMGMGQGGQVPMMQGMEMGSGMQGPMMGHMGLNMNPGQDMDQGQEQGWGYGHGGEAGIQSPQQGWVGGHLGTEGGMQSPMQGFDQQWQGFNPYNPQSGQYQGQGPGQGQWQGGQYYSPGQGGQGWGWQ